MITLKIKYIVENNEDNQVIVDYQKQYNSLLHLFYNRLKEGISETNCKHLSYNNVDLMNSWFRQSCVKDASYLLKEKEDETILFGGKKLYYDLLRKNITKEEFKEKRLLPLCSIGEGRCNGNRLFRLHPNDKYYSVIFQPTTKTKIKLNLIGLGKRIKILDKIYQHQLLKDTPISYKLDKKFIYISFDEVILQEDVVKPINNRIFAIDLNPNYVGYSIIEWKNSEKFNLIKSGVISLKNINDKEYALKELKLSSTDRKRIKLNNKRQFETLEVSKFLINLAKHYKSECFGIEDLCIKLKDNKLGKNFNQLVNNNWCRDKLVNNLKKRCNIMGIKFVEIQPQYSSIIGNLLYRELELPDMVLSSIEISRRCYEFNLQYLKKIKEKTKNVVFPIMTKLLLDKVKHSLEEVKCFIDFVDWKQLGSELKKSKIKYRFPLDERVFQTKNLKFVNVFYNNLIFFNILGI